MQMTDGEIRRLKRKFNRLIEEITNQVKDTGDTNITDTDFMEVVKEELDID